MAQRTASIPKYLEIVRDIVEQINGGTLPLGTQVLSENQIIETYQVSNTTARRALAELERAGWVTRIKGKGTYVRQSRVDRSANRILSFTKNMREAGRVPTTKLLGVRTLDESRTLEVGGREYTLAGPVYEVRRLRFADGIPMMSETRYVSMQFCPGLNRRNLEESLYDIYERDYGLRLARVDQMLSATILEEEALEAFQIEDLVPAFRVEGVTFIGKELILEMEDSLYRGDIYRFYVAAM